MSIFSNWPSHVPLEYIYSVNFSSDCHYMAIANDKGKVPLYRLVNNNTSVLLMVNEFCLFAKLSHFYMDKSII